MYKRIVVTGSIAFDHIMGMPGHFKDHIMPDKVHMLNVSFLMDRFRKEFGGTGANVSYNLGLLGVPNLLVTSGGGDLAQYFEHLKKYPTIDLSGVKVTEGEDTAQAFAMTDRDDNQIWAFYQGAMRHAPEIDLAEYLREGDFVFIGPNDPAAMKKYVSQCREAGVPYMFDPAFAIPHFSAEELALAIDGAEILIGNDYEMELMSRSADLSKVGICVTTLGAQGSRINDLEIAAVSVDCVDPTGAGDAYRGGFLAEYIKGASLEECGKTASRIAAAAVSKYGTQNHIAEDDVTFDELFKSPDIIKEANKLAKLLKNKGY